VRALGLDLGAKRIGVAVSDDAGTVATPLEVVQRTGDRRGDHRRLAALASEWEVDVVVVGLPLSLDGRTGPAASGVLAEVRQLEGVLGVPVATQDERLTTVTAQRQLHDQGLDARASRKVVDMVAASVLLQSWLDAGGSAPRDVSAAASPTDA
jgi:putative Holliday junction resolvase